MANQRNSSTPDDQQPLSQDDEQVRGRADEADEFEDEGDDEDLDDEQDEEDEESGSF